jgi:hypothetical protein
MAERGQPRWADDPTPTARLRVTGAVLFTTLELPRVSVVHVAGSWPSGSWGSDPRAPATRSVPARLAGWLLGR